MTTLLEPGAGERLETSPTATVVVKAGADSTGGSLFLGEVVLAAGAAGPPLHRHARLHDAFWVLEGTLTLHLGEERHAAPAGSFACVPPGVAHTFSNPGAVPVRFLNISTPAGAEAYLRALTAGPPSPELLAHHDIEPA